LESSAAVLLGEVSGAGKYLTAFRRSTRTIYYGCTCPFFTEGLVGCKHLWALVRTAGQSAFVRCAGDCDEFKPSADTVFREPEEPTVEGEMTSENQESLGAQLARSLLIHGRR
jgi:hypothetical protein